MYISIPSGLTIIISIILVNFIFSLSKQKILSICYIIISGILGVAGCVWTFILPKRLNYQLHNYMVNERLDKEFVTWALDKFRPYAMWSLIATIIILITCSCIFFLASIKKENNAWHAVGYIVNIYRFALILYGFLYSYKTINKRFDITSYIMNITLAECLILYIPLLIKKKLSWKKQ